MQDETRRRIHSAIYMLMRPLARIFLRSGVGFREFSEISKSAFVDVATKDYGLRGRPTNISRVAVMTGLTRKEVRRLRQKAEDSDGEYSDKDSPISQILHRWHTNTDYLSESGEPLALKVDGDHPSFSSLVRKYGGDVPPGAMRTELDRIEALAVQPDGRVLPTKRIAINIDLNDRIVGGISKILYPAALNIAHNIEANKEGDDPEWWANLIAHTKYIRERDRGRFLRISNDRIKEFAKSIDDMSAGFESVYDLEEDGSAGGANTLGVGIFYFEEDKADSAFFE